MSTVLWRNVCKIFIVKYCTVRAPQDDANWRPSPSNRFPVLQFLRVASRCSRTLLTPEVPQPQPTDSSSRAEGEREGRGGAASTDTGEHGGTTCQHHIQVRSGYGDVCGIVMWWSVGVLFPYTANQTAMHSVQTTLCGPTLY